MFPILYQIRLYVEASNLILIPVLLRIFRRVYYSYVSYIIYCVETKLVRLQEQQYQQLKQQDNLTTTVRTRERERERERERGDYALYSAKLNLFSSNFKLASLSTVYQLLVSHIVTSNHTEAHDLCLCISISEYICKFHCSLFSIIYWKEVLELISYFCLRIIKKLSMQGNY